MIVDIVGWLQFNDFTVRILIIPAIADSQASNILILASLPQLIIDN